MKTRLFFACFLSILALSSFAQFDANYQTPYEEETIDKPAAYINLSGGLDNHVGLAGVSLSVPVYKKLGIRTGVGIGAWGLKYNVGLRLIDYTQRGWRYGIGYSFCPGVKEIELTFTDTSGGSRVVNMDLLPVGSLNATIGYQWMVGSKNIFYLESGFAFKSSHNKIYETNDGSTLTADEEFIMEIVRPGGFIIALGFQIGL